MTPLAAKAAKIASALARIAVPPTKTGTVNRSANRPATRLPGTVATP